MAFWKICIALAVIFSPINGVLNNKELKRREASLGDTYGPPPRPVYGAPPQQQIPHRQYGVPQQLPFREYGPPPSLQYGPPKSNFNFGNFHKSSKPSFHEQIKSHFGVPKPFYGPPHFQHKPSGGFNGPATSYGPPPQGNPFTTYGPPHPQKLPLAHPGPIFRPGPKPHNTYGPPPQVFIGKPASQYGPPPKPHGNYGPPQKIQTTYGPPQQQQQHIQLPPVYVPPSTSYGVPETTVVVESAGGQVAHNGHIGHGGHGGIASLPVKEVQIQIESHGHGHDHNGGNNGGSPFPVSCDGWKPIPAPAGHYVEQNIIQTDTTGYSGNGNGGLTDDQLIAVALQSGGFESGPVQPISVQTQIGNYHEQHQNLNAINSESLQLTHGSIDDSYTRPPADSFAPNSIHAAKYNTIEVSNGLVPPSGQYGAPLGGSYQSSAVETSGHLGIQYGEVSGNLQPWQNQALQTPRKPVAFRPPVPQGLLESIGASVQHLDKFGVKPEIQPNQYIPPPPSEIPQQQVNYQVENYNSIEQHQQQQQQQQQQHEHHHHQQGQLQAEAFVQNLQQQEQQYHGNFNQQQQFATENVHAQSLPNYHEARFSHQHDCGHGPNLVGANINFGANQLTGYNNVEQNIHSHEEQQNINVVPSISYGAPLSDGYQENQQQNFGGIPSNTYGPPANDVIGYESKQSTAIASLSDNNKSVNEQLPGLENLNVVSAQKSQSVTIPVQGQQGSYQLQFQSAGPAPSPLNGEQQANHEQILSQGLLQSILTAIEQPNSNNNNNNQQHQLQSRSDNHVAAIDDDDSKSETSDDTNSSQIDAKPSVASESNDSSK